MSDGAVLLAVCATYFAIVLAIGFAAYRHTGTTAEDYFLGSRTARTVVLFMALFGTNVTPFVLMGIPGLAYHHGVGVFGYNAAIIALGIPVSFYLIGYRAWVAARELKAITPAELYARRLGCVRAALRPTAFEGATSWVVVVVASLRVGHGMGGVSEATRAVMSEHPELLSKGDRPIFSPGSWASWALAISLTVIAFPHMM